MALQDVFGVALNEQVGSLAAERGFRRSRRVWRRASARGDWVAFDVQSSQWNTADSIRCIVNIGATPAPWLDFEAETSGRPRGTFAPSKGIFETRLAPPGSSDGQEVWWQINTPAEAESVAWEIAQQMLGHGFPLLDELQQRDRMLERLREGRMGAWEGTDHDEYLAVVLADDGLIAELGDVLARASEWMEPDRFTVLRAWCEERVATRVLR